MTTTGGDPFGTVFVDSNGNEISSPHLYGFYFNSILGDCVFARFVAEFV